MEDNFIDTIASAFTATPLQKINVNFMVIAVFLHLTIVSNPFYYLSLRRLVLFLKLLNFIKIPTILTQFVLVLYFQFLYRM